MDHFQVGSDWEQYETLGKPKEMSEHKIREVVRERQFGNGNSVLENTGRCWTFWAI